MLSEHIITTTGAPAGLCEALHSRTKANPVVIILPPEAPITRVSESDFRMEGAIMEGGCSPEDTRETASLLVLDLSLRSTRHRPNNSQQVS